MWWPREDQLLSHAGTSSGTSAVVPLQRFARSPFGAPCSMFSVKRYHCCQLSTLVSVFPQVYLLDL